MEAYHGISERRIQSSRMPRGTRGIQTFRCHNVSASLRSQIALASTPKSVSQKGGCQSEKARPKTQERDRHRNVAARQLERLIVRVPGEFGVCEPLADDLRH